MKKDVDIIYRGIVIILCVVGVLSLCQMLHKALYG